MGSAGGAVAGPLVVSSGFTAIDIRLGTELIASPGGTATNVARALSTLGWQSTMVGTVGSDPGAQLIKRVLDADGVQNEDLVSDSAWLTPVLLQVTVANRHRWEYHCPICGARYAKHRPPAQATARAIVSRFATPDVFFFDRTSLFTIALARAWSAAGSLVVFEPATLGRPHLFGQALEVADFVKFSSERRRSFEKLLDGAPVSQVETLGVAGARFREKDQVEWQYVPGAEVVDVIDTVGAGDWTTAGIIDSLWSMRDGGEIRINMDSISEALTRGQALGATACGWSGVFYGGIESLSPDELEAFACPRYLRQENHYQVRPEPLHH
jgi:fructokinase